MELTVKNGLIGFVTLIMCLVSAVLIKAAFYIYPIPGAIFFTLCLVAIGTCVIIGIQRAFRAYDRSVFLREVQVNVPLVGPVLKD